MEKTIKTSTILDIGTYLKEPDCIKNLGLKAGSLFAAVKIKKLIEEKFNAASEAIQALALDYGATPIPDSQQMQIPLDKLADFNRELTELNNETTIIYYDPIKIPADIEVQNEKFMDIFFDFIELID